MAEGGVTAKAAGGAPVPSRFLAIDAAPGAAPDPVEAAGCGFDALLLACPRPVMAGGSPVPGELARTAHKAGLALLLDVELDRFPIDHRLVSAHASLFELRRRRPDGEAVDPRRPPPPVGEAKARLQAPEAERLAPAIGTRLAELVSGGATGFRIRRPETVDGTLLTQILAPARELDPGLVLVAHTPGVPWDEARSLLGFDRFVSSLSWWDGRAPWLAEEYEALRTGAPLLAEVTAEAAGRARDKAARERLALLAAGTASGFILPPALMGEAQAAADLLEMTRRYGGEMRLAADGNGVTAILRGDHSDLRCSAEAMLLLVDSGNARAAGAADPEAERAPGFDADAAAAVGAEFQPFRRARGTQPPLAKLERNEVRLLVGRRSKPVRLSRKSGGPKAARAAAAQARLVIERISPGVDDGAFAAKRTVGDVVTVEATVYADGHEQLAAELRWRAADQKSWQAARMEELGNDRWRAAFPLTRLGRFEFAVEAWLDRYGGFRRDFGKKLGAGVARPVDAAEGRNLVAAAADRSSGEPGDRLDEFVRRLDRVLDAGGDDLEDAAGILLDPDLAQLMDDADERPFALLSGVRPVDAERLAARYSSWYELFPRSQADGGGGKRHGTFDDVVRRLPQIRAMGFDTLYFPPIHPIGRTHRKGRNNALTAAPDDPGSPYAIGGEEGGHDALHPELGSFEDFRRLVRAAHEQGLEIALDFAIQCSPDHPWLKEHPGWFDWRPDGTIKYAENPPKQYEDIVNVDFFNKESIPGLWLALRDVVLFWVGEGVKVFRVDNPHTKPFAFWQWLIADVRGPHPDVIFLSEAFTRPAVMYRLAKIGFSQSYTYFTWRNSKAELTAYLTELTTGAVSEFFRPHFFVNTPDINPPWLQAAGRAGFRIRAALAATLSGLFGVYSGFELCESEPVPGKEEYHESEKYEIKPRDWQAPGNIIADIALLNRLRRAYAPLQTHLGLRFYNAWNDQVLYYGKQAAAGGEMILVAVSLDPHNPQGADFEVPLWEWGLPDHAAVDVQDLADGRRLRWSGKVQHVELHPDQPYAIWRLAPGGAAA